VSRSLTLEELLADDVAVPPDMAATRVSGLTLDSRAVRPGDAFIALRSAGGQRHGLQYLEEARLRGASCVLFETPAPEGVALTVQALPVADLRSRLGRIADRWFAGPSFDLTVIGVTGTNGKTSTVQLLGQAWTLRGTTAGTIGTLGAGLYGDVRPTGFTTPLVLQMHALLAELRDAGAAAVAMEVSSHALDQGRVDGVHFRVGVFTNLTRDHLDYHGDMEAYGAAKARLFAWPGLQAAVLNLDDAHGRRLHADLPDGVLRIGTSAAGATAASVRAVDPRLDTGGIGFGLAIGDQVHPVRSPLLGRFNIDNLLAVAGVLHALGGGCADIAATLSALRPIPGRMNRLGGDAGTPVVVIDYAHTPDALEQALDSLRAHVQGRLVCVFGCGGERDRGKRPQMAAIAERLADAVLVTDDNPRREDGDTIVAEILAGFTDRDAVIVQRDRKTAIAQAIGMAGSGDIVLVAGKGHEPYQEIAGVCHPFDDTAVARTALEAWR
jgi:UDP-N-acetylmuramoyl-L-alanyl-D-glutamate--2,6-diaminopimelate ligase